MGKVFVGTPTTRPFEKGYIASLISTNWGESYTWYVVEGKPVDVGRNELVSAFLKDKGSEWLLMADSDATWHPEAVNRLIERQHPVVTACIYKRGLPPVPTFGPLDGVNQEGNAVYDFGVGIRAIVEYCDAHGIDTKTENALVLPKHERDLLPVDGCGMHFCLIHRSTFDLIQPPYFVESKGGGGEDFYFCQKVRAAGLPIVADLSVHTGHIAGPGMDFGLRELLAFYQHTNLLKEDQHHDVGIRL